MVRIRPDHSELYRNCDCVFAIQMSFLLISCAVHKQRKSGARLPRFVWFDLLDPTLAFVGPGRVINVQIREFGRVKDRALNARFALIIKVPQDAAQNRKQH